ncbi:hypothetical protein [Haloferula sp. BvORR071]|uniref:hypothetical protein n=1 Tax=Haloferula sp. BvORR071 TaxID=1396141 RepID=UPI002240FA5E|nr:hypothetical protein [Haloferula sp. BvORR071]
MESPYAPPQAADPVIKRRAAGKVARLTTRILGLLATVGAGVLLHFIRRISSMAEELGVHSLPSSPGLDWLLLRNEGWLSFLAALALAAAGVVLSFRSSGRTLAMLGLVLSALALDACTYVGWGFLVLAVIRATGV